MKKTLLILLFCANTAFTVVAQQKPAQSAIGFYNIENLFDTDDDPNTIDEEFLPNGTNKWTTERYQQKLANMSKVLAAMSLDIVGLCEGENRKVLEDLVQHPNLIQHRYQILHLDMRDARGVDVAR